MQRRAGTSCLLSHSRLGGLIGVHYSDNRIWGPGEWGNVGRYTWDAAKLIVETDLAEVHGIFANRVEYRQRRRAHLTMVTHCPAL